MGDWTLPTIAVLLLGYAAVSSRLQSSWVSPAMVFGSAGLLVGNRVLDLVDLDVGAPFVRHLAEATLAVLLFTDAVRINLAGLRRQALLPTRLLGLGLPLTIVAGTVAARVLLPDLDLWTAAALATILAPTDAALGQPVMSNERLPGRIRQGLNVESGLNDGICVPLLIIFLTLARSDVGAEPLEPVRVVAEEIGYGLVGGVLAGALAGWAVRSFLARGWMSHTWQQISGVATPLLAYTVAAALGGSGFIAAFVAGLAFEAIGRRDAEPSTALAEQSGELLNAVTFLVFGAVLLAPALSDVTWSIAGYVLLSLTVVRMLPVALAMLGTQMRSVTVVFLGWFGPRGLASIVFILLLVEESGLPEAPLLLTVVTLTVAASVFAHGATAWWGANRYADWYAAHHREHHSMTESHPVEVQRLRTVGGRPGGGVSPSRSAPSS